MTCSARERTSAYLDGELDAAESARAERHIETCADCRALVASAALASEALRAPGARLAAPPELRARLQRALEAETRRAPAGREARRSADRFWLGSLVGAVATALAASLALVVLPFAQAETWPARLADAHVQALMDGRTIEVASTDHHTVKPWFAGRAPVSPPVSDFAAQGFPLSGGRVQRVGRETLAVVVYRHGAHQIDLFVWPQAGLPAPQWADRRGYHVLTWTGGDLAYAAVSDASRDELVRFERLVRSGGE